MKKGVSCRGNNKNAQITVFVILALVIIGSIVVYFLFKDKIFPVEVPSEIKPAYEYYSSCIQNVVEKGADIMSSQAGYIYLPEFRKGSEYAPFSSELGFMGLGVPYWYYITENGLKSEQIPSKKNMEAQLARYLKEEIAKCDFSSLKAQGYIIEVQEPTSSSMSIENDKIKGSLNQKISIAKGESNFILSSQSFETNSQLGDFYNKAREIYNYEKKSSFLENYSIDVLYTYAPVSGSEISCSPVYWNAYEVIDKLKLALEANIGAIKINGNYYTQAKNSDYFTVGKGELDVGGNRVNFIYSKDFPSRFEVWPTENNIMTAKPLGSQPGLSAMGFCYAPYKFVYDMSFPVLVQIYNSDAKEIFQFPVAVVINKNVPRISAGGEVVEQTSSICSNANTDITINTYNLNLEPVQADLKFRCLTEVCNIGKSKIDNESGIASIKVKVPQCVNGIIIANAEGYSEKKYTLSTNEEDSADIVLDKQYKLNLEVYIDGSLTSDLAVLMIEERGENSSNFIDSISYPGIKELKLSEGDYSLSLYVYKNSALTIPETTIRQCAEVPQTGIGGLFGMTEEKCSDITIPSQKINNMLYAGGKLNSYITPDMVENAKSIKIYARSIKLPSTIEEIQTSQEQIEGKAIEIQII